MQFSKKDIFIEIKKRDYAWSMSKFHFHNSYEIYYLASGKRTILSEQKIYDLHTGDVLLFRPNFLHKGAGSDAHEKFGVEFSKKFFDYYFTAPMQDELLHCFNYNIIHLHTEDQKTFEHLYKKMYDEYINGDFYAVTIAEILLLLNRAGKQYENEIRQAHQAPSKTSERINTVLSYIEENFSEIKSIDEIAEHSYINKSYLCRLFKKETNMTVMDYLYNYRIQQACEMLTSSESSVAKVAQQCGFENTSHFIKMFKTMLDCTPGQFRKNRK